MSDDELRRWAESHEGLGFSLAAGILRLLAERDDARRVASGLADRVAAQSELLTGRAVKGSAPAA